MFPKARVDQNPARQIPCTFFSSTTFPTGQQYNSIGYWLSLVDLSATAALSCKQCYKGVNKIVRFYCHYYNTICFNNLFLHILRKSHCIRPSIGQAVGNSALRSKFWPPFLRRYFICFLALKTFYLLRSKRKSYLWGSKTIIIIGTGSQGLSDTAFPTTLKSVSGTAKRTTIITQIWLPACENWCLERCSKPAEVHE